MHIVNAEQEEHDRGKAYMREGGREGTGSKPCTRRREVPTRALKALPKTLLATLGLPKVMHLMSASGYSSAAHAAPAQMTMPVSALCEMSVDKRALWR